MSVHLRLRHHAIARRGATVVTAAALAVVPLTVSASSASAGPQAIEQCRQVRNQPVGSDGWTVPVPAVWESSSTNCNLKYGDLPQREPQYPLGDPAAAIRALQRNLNYCYGAALTVDGLYGSNTRAVVTGVQRRHGITADGVYGPQTRSAMNWRLWSPGLGIWSSGCYSPL